MSKPFNYNSTYAELETKFGLVQTRADLPTDAKFGDRYEILEDEDNSDKYTRVVKGEEEWTTVYIADQ